jgi:hypothetical protein
MVPWIAIMGSTSIPAGSPPISPDKSRIWSFYLRNSLVPASFVAHPASSACATPGFPSTLLRSRLLQDCATADPMD